MGAMSGFDEPGIFYSDSFGGEPAADEGQVRKSQLQRRFKEFLRQYRVGTDRTGFTFKYRCCRHPWRSPIIIIILIYMCFLYVYVAYFNEPALYLTVPLQVLLSLLYCHTLKPLG